MLVLIAALLRNHVVLSCLQTSQSIYIWTNHRFHITKLGWDTISLNSGNSKKKKKTPKSDTESFLAQEPILAVRKSTFCIIPQQRRKISLHSCTVWSESSLPSWRNLASLAFQTAPKEDSDQTARMRRLIWIFAGYRCLKVRLLTLRLSCIFRPNPKLIKPGLRERLEEFQNSAGAQHFLQNRMCDQRRHRSACPSSQADKSIRSPPEDALVQSLPRECPAMTNQPARTRRLTWVFAKRTCNLAENAVPRIRWKPH